MSRVRSLLPLDPVTWILGVARSPVVLVPEDGSETMRPELFLWLSEEGVLGISGHPSESRAEAIEASLITAIQDPQTGAPRRPSRVRTADPDDAQVVRRLLGEEAVIEVDATPEIPALLELLAEVLPGAASTAGASAFPGSDPAIVHALFHSMASLHRRAPWTRMRAQGERYFRIDVPSLGIEGACLRSISSATFRAVLLYDSFEHLREHLLREQLDQDEEPDEDTVWHVPHTIVGYLPTADVHPAERRYALANGLEVASPDAFPAVRMVDEGQPRSPHAPELVRIHACLAAFARYVTKHGSHLRTERDRACSVEHEAVGVEGPVMCRGPYRVGLPRDRMERWRLAWDEHPLRRATAAFLAWHGPFERAETENLDLELACFDVLEFELRQRTRLGSWTPAMIDGYFFECLPVCRLGAADRAHAPELVAALARWMEATGAIDPGRADAACARVAELRDDHLAAEARLMRGDPP